MVAAESARPATVRLQVDAVIGAFAIASLDREFLVEHVDFLDQLGRDRLEAGDFLIATSISISASVGGSSGFSAAAGTG